MLMGTDPAGLNELASKHRIKNYWGQTYTIDKIACFQENLICLLFEITAIEGAKDGEAFTDLISRSFLSCYLRRE